jgi:hypothetical protein
LIDDLPAGFGAGQSAADDVDGVQCVCHGVAV